MRRFGALLSGIGIAALAFLAVDLFRGPSDSAIRSVHAIAAISLVVAAIGVALRRGPAPLAVFLLGMAAPLANTRLIGSSDTVPTALVPFAMVRNGSLFLPGPGENVVPAAGGRFASKYPVTTGLLALPFALPAAAGRAPIERIANVIEKLCASALTGLMLALLFVAQRALCGPRLSLVASALTLFGSAALPILGQALWQHTGAALALAAGLAARGIHTGPRRSFVVGACAGLALSCRPADAPLALGLIWLDRRLAAAAGAAVPIVLTLAYQRVMFGGFLRTGYGLEATAGWRPVWPEGLVGMAGLWLSPGRGLAVIYPLTVFGLWGLWRRRELRPLALAVAAETALLGCWWVWEGGWSMGPRMLSAATPFLGLGLAAALEEHAKWSASARRLLIGAAAISCATAMTLAYVLPNARTHALVRELRYGAWTVRAYPLLAYLIPSR